jgi:diguanylate cyclase (GGDEF)-like protein
MTVVRDVHYAIAGSDATAYALLDALPDATAVLDQQGVIVSANRAWHTFCGSNGGDPDRSAVGVNYLDVCRRSAASGCADATAAAAAIHAVLAGEAVERVLDYECSSPTVVRWFMMRVKPVHHPGLGAMVTHTDVTLRKIMEQDLAERTSLDPLTRLGDRDHLDLVVRSAPSGDVGVLYIHLEGLDAVSDEYGVAAHDEVLQTVGRRLTAVTRPGDGIARLGRHDFAVAAPMMTASGLTGLVARVRHALGESVHVHGRTVELDASVGACLAAAGDDLNECLRQADESGYPVRHLASAEGTGPADPPGAADPPTAADPSGAAVPVPVVPAVCATDVPATPIDHPDRAQLSTRVAPSVHRAHGTDLEQLLDERTTELQHRTIELAAARKELEDFSYSVSHDLKAPLRAVSGFARILVEDHSQALDAEGRHHLERIQSSAQEMGAQLDGLLTLSRLQRRRVNRELLDMTAMVRQVWQDLRPADRPVSLDLAELPAAEGDRELVADLLAAILGNAVKFTARAGSARVEVSAEPTDDTVTYVVQDNGAGFDMRLAHRLFRPLQRLHPATEYPGIGIGLALAHQIVRRHGGTINAVSAPDQGTRIAFTLGTAAVAGDIAPTSDGIGSLRPSTTKS